MVVFASVSWPPLLLSGALIGSGDSSLVTRGTSPAHVTTPNPLLPLPYPAWVALAVSLPGAFPADPSALALSMDVYFESCLPVLSLSGAPPALEDAQGMTCRLSTVVPLPAVPPALEDAQGVPCGVFTEVPLSGTPSALEDAQGVPCGVLTVVPRSGVPCGVFTVVALSGVPPPSDDELSLSEEDAPLTTPSLAPPS